jgi:uncharacterized repeat protein (TIGR03847 family)
MPFMSNDLDNVERITIEAIGQPGQRVFYLQASAGLFMLTLVIEKEQARALAAAIAELLDQITEKWPDRSTPPARPTSAFGIIQPFEPQFRVGQFGLGYDDEHDQVVLVAQELMPEGEEDQAAVVSMHVSRALMRELATHALHVVNAGRPLCPLCGQPMDPSGHFCTRRNGHDA